MAAKLSAGPTRRRGIADTGWLVTLSGASRLRVVEGVIEGKADTVLAASIFHYAEHTVAEAKVRTAAAIPVRPA